MNKTTLQKALDIAEDLNAYALIADYYGEKIAQRSGVPLINHIHEGLIILSAIGASSNAMQAYCLHPILQSDEALADNLHYNFAGINHTTLLLTMEYRSVANEYLSKRTIQGLNEIRLSPLKDVNDMLIADKVQNRKDFDLYHKGTHERSEALSAYFQNWLARLGISEARYQELIALI